MQDAYDDGCDYFYQINDDTLINTVGWAEVFTRELRENPLGRNVGVTGPADTNNRRILTHAFVHRYCVYGDTCLLSVSSNVFYVVLWCIALDDASRRASLCKCVPVPVCVCVCVCVCDGCLHRRFLLAFLFSS